MEMSGKMGIIAVEVELIDLLRQGIVILHSLILGILIRVLAQNGLMLLIRLLFCRIVGIIRGIG